MSTRSLSPCESSASAPQPHSNAGPSSPAPALHPPLARNAGAGETEVLQTGTKKKLPKLPKGARIHKRPLMHPPIASAYSSANTKRIIYISAKTPFIAAVKKTRKLLDTSHSEQLQADRKRREVLLQATSKAIEKALSLALHFQAQPDCLVQVRTGSVGMVDDIVMPTDSIGDSLHNQELEMPESRVRMASKVEISISLR